MSSYKELNNLVRKSGKFFNKNYTNLSPNETKELNNLTYKIKITREDLLKKAIDKRLQKENLLDEKDNNLMDQLRRGQ